MEDNLGRDNVIVAQIIRDLGRIYLLEGKKETAEEYMTLALQTLQKHNHPERYKCLEYLSDLYWEKFKEAQRAENVDTAQTFREQSIEYLRQAQKVIKKQQN